MISPKDWKIHGSASERGLILKLERIILLRLLIVAFFLTLGAIVFEMPAVVYYGVLSGFLVLSFFYTLWLATKKYVKVLTYFQIVVDLLAITIFVYYTGGADSVLATLYALATVGAGFLLFPNAPLVVAFLSSAFFVAIVALDASGWLLAVLPPPERAFHISRDWLYVGYMSYVRVTIFMIIGFLSRHLVQSIGKMEQSLQAKEKFSLLGEMAMYLAHEIKNPLLTISGNIELIKEEAKDKLSPEDQKIMETIVQESQRLKALFDEVSDYARSEALDLKPVNLNEILDEALALVKPICSNGKIVRMVPEYRENPPSLIEADRNRIKQVFLNLIFNALEAMPEGGTLAVRTRRNAVETKVMIKDTGVGMDSKQVRELFIPFKSEKKGGSGLGLAIAYKIVRSHGGRIKVKSRRGKGTTFMVSLPSA
jgi:signal transduction histidine kinase